MRGNVLDEMSTEFIHPSDFTKERTPAIERLLQYNKLKKIPEPTKEKEKE